VENVRAYLLISGLVQGVFFRYSARLKAEELGIAGWARNLLSGQVEIMAEGKQEAVEQLVQWAHHGPRGAHVRNVEIEYGDYTGEFSSFSIR
jgi:acylphosphatase